jgi:hypothetical protein
MALVEHVDANRHALLNTRKLPVYSTCRLCQQTKNSQPPRGVPGAMRNGMCSREWDERRIFSSLKLEPLARGVNPDRKS